MVFSRPLPGQQQRIRGRSAKHSAKLKLNDSSFTYQPENSEGPRLRLPLRLPRHAPPRDHSAAPRARQRPRPGPHRAQRHLRNPQPQAARSIIIDNPQNVPDAGQIEEFREPIVKISFLLPIEEHRRHHVAVHRPPRHLHPHRIPQPDAGILVYELPLAEVIYDLYDKLKSVTHGYGTMDYDFLGYRPADLVRLDMLVHDKRVDALSIIVHRASAERRGRKLIKKLRRKSIGICSRSPCRRPSAPGSLPARRSRR